MSNNTKHCVLVTGGCGFIGSHIVDKLIGIFYKVVVVDDLSTGSLDNLNKDAIFYQGDVCDKYFIDKVFEQHKFDYVIHESTTINTNALHEKPLHDVNSSINSTIIIAENCIKQNVKNFIFASSVAVYGRPESMPVSENSNINPIYSYGIAKFSAEYYLKYFNAYYGLNYQILRYANVFGPRQNIFGEVGVIAIYTDRLIKNDPLIIYGDGEHKRDYIYVSDVVEFTIKSMKFNKPSTYNVGRGVPVSVNELFDEFNNSSLKNIFAIYKPERFGEIGSLYCDVSYALKAGLEIRNSLKKGIKKTVDYFYNKHNDKY